MKGAIAGVLCLMWSLNALPAAGETDADTQAYAIAEQVAAVYQVEGEDGVFRFLESSIRRARAQGALTPAWSVLFMMLADSARNTRQNAAYALRIADEGLELARSGTAEDLEMAVMLEVSRAYILADLGRGDEAAAAAVMALPAFRETFGDVTADDLKTSAETWAEGGLTSYNYAADVVAAKVLADADAAFDRGEYGQMLALAARAVLPEDAGLAPEILAKSNAKAGLLRGQALYLLGQLPAALAALQGAADLAAPGWADGRPDWRFAPKEAAPLPADLFFWLGRSASVLGETERASLALDLADQLTTQPRARNTLLFARAGLMESMGQVEAAIAALRKASRAPDPGLADQSALAGFYAELLTARSADAIADLQPDALFASAEAAIAQEGPGSAVSPEFVRTQAAPYLLLAGQPERALAYARRAFTDRMQAIQTSQDSEAGTLAAQKAAREVLDVYLASTHALASIDPNAHCPEIEGAGCVIFEE